MSAACVCGWCTGKGEERVGERGYRGRPFEVIEIATTENKMLKEKVPNNIGWTSTWATQTLLLLNRPAMC